MKTGGIGLWEICEFCLRKTDEIGHKMENINPKNI